MPVWTGLIPREGLTADPIGRVIKKTLLNPAITFPLLLLAKYTHRGQLVASRHESLLEAIRVFVYLGLVRWVNGYLSRGGLNNWQSDHYDWEKEIVLVTGGSDGIGSRVVQLLAEKGIKVAVLDVQPLTFEAGPSVHYFKCDVTSPAAIAAAAADIRSALGQPTVLINNAGAARGKTILDSTEADVRLTFDVNTLSHYWLVKEFLPSMIANNHGMVVTVASLASYITLPQMVDYASSKAAALSFHEGLASELKTRYKAPKVRTVAVTIGHTKTPLFVGWSNEHDFLVPSLEPETVAEAIVEKVLAGSSGQVVLPGICNLYTGFRGWPHWMQNALRQSGHGTMVNWRGRQVMDAEAKYAKR